MAKMKDFAVTIEYTVRETLYVAARRPAGAAERALTDVAYAEAHRFDCDHDDYHGCLCGPSRLPAGARAIEVRPL